MIALSDESSGGNNEKLVFNPDSLYNIIYPDMNIEFSESVFFKRIWGNYQFANREQESDYIWSIILNNLDIRKYDGEYIILGGLLNVPSLLGKNCPDTEGMWRKMNDRLRRFGK
jgi:hypothetical protein